MESREKRHILIVRTDRIGDVILTLPVAAALRSRFPRSRISMWVREYTRGLAEGQSGVSDVMLDDEDGRQKPFLHMLSELRRAKVDVAIVAYPRFRIALLLWLARVPVRVGTGYRWYSFLFNRRVHEHRKAGVKSEAAYNLGLLTALDMPVPDVPRIRLRLSPGHRRAARALRKRLGIAGRDRLVVIHPGSGGSARDWPEVRFAALAGALSREGFRVAVVGTVPERDLVERLSRAGGSMVIPVVGGQTLLDYAAFIETASLFVANSTGPLHVAAAVGTPVIGFYPNDRVMGPARWGPLADRKAIFVPRKDGCAACDAGACEAHGRMQTIPVEAVLGEAVQMLRPKRSGTPRRTARHTRTRSS